MLWMEENELVTRVGSETPMGRVMRRYWVPALLSWELERDWEPVRVRLLGEDLVAFRDTKGRVGLLDEFCAHRRTSLFLGRNEEGGLRCVFHGWKYDVDGNCVDMPNELPQYDFKQKVKIKNYPVIEQGGIVWTYMGPNELQPPPPNFEWTLAPPNQRYVTKVIEECNWLQALEGGIDSVHSSFLHRRFPKTGEDPRLKPVAPAELEVELTDYGFRYASLRPMPDGRNFVRAYHYVMPFTQVRSEAGSAEAGRDRIRGHYWVPMDDETTMVYNWRYSLHGPIGDSYSTDDANGPLAVDQKTFRSYRNKSNNWLQDRLAQKYETFTGIRGVNTQDRAAQEAMGAIVDRSKEHLGQTDRAIIAARKLLIQATRVVADGGSPVGADDSYYSVRAIERVLPRDVRWQDAMLAEMYAVPVR